MGGHDRVISVRDQHQAAIANDNGFVQFSVARIHALNGATLRKTDPEVVMVNCVFNDKYNACGMPLNTFGRTPTLSQSPCDVHA
jgi:hypothetical protein